METERLWKWVTLVVWGVGGELGGIFAGLAVATALKWDLGVAIGAEVGLGILGVVGATLLGGSLIRVDRNSIFVGEHEIVSRFEE